MFKSQGFTLVEMAIVLVIVGLLLGFSFAISSRLMKINRAKEAKARMEAVKKALIGFAVQQGRFPYAASNTLGVEDTTTPTYADYVPYLTINMTKANARGMYSNIFRYDITGSGSQTTDPKLTDTSPQTICLQIDAYLDKVDTPTTSVTIGSTSMPVAFVLLSPGPDKVFADSYVFPNNAVSRSYIAQSSSSDDIVVWETFDELYKDLGCGNEFFKLYNDAYITTNPFKGITIYVLGGGYSTCTPVKYQDWAYIQKGTVGYSDSNCTYKIFTFQDCLEADFSNGDRDSKVELIGNPTSGYTVIDY